MRNINNKPKKTTLLLQTWTDEYLKWDPKLFGGITSVTVDGNDVWTPDLSIFNK